MMDCKGYLNKHTPEKYFNKSTGEKDGQGSLINCTIIAHPYNALHLSNYSLRISLTTAHAYYSLMASHLIVLAII